MLIYLGSLYGFVPRHPCLLFKVFPFERKLITTERSRALRCGVRLIQLKAKSRIHSRTGTHHH